MKKIFLILSLAVSTFAFGQPKFNKTLKKQLDSVMVMDQLYRDTLTLLMDQTKPIP